MFSNLFFLILVLLLVNFTDETSSSKWPLSPEAAFAASIALYIGTLALIVLQNKLSKFLYKKRPELLALANVELLVFLTFFHFALGAERFFQTIPFTRHSQAFAPLFSLALYFLGIGVYHYTSFKTSSSSFSESSATAYAKQQLRMLIPFALPFIFFMLFLDTVQFLLPEKWQAYFFNGESHAGILLFTALSLLFMCSILLILPFFIQKIWASVPLENSPLKTRLELLCQKAHFSCAGIMVWTTMKHALTAAIIGVVPRYRYIMFTPRLLKELPPASIESILAHEIGHSYRKHLLIFPFIILGMVVTAGLFSLIGSDAIDRFFGLKEILYPHTLLWPILYPFVLFIPYALLIALYFRYVFGYFSRLFERQADLHVYELNLPSADLIYALDYLGTATGNTHAQPNWHHFSIQERIDFLKACEKTPLLIEKHHKKVRKALLAYSLLFLACLSFLLAPFFPESLILKPLNSIIGSISHSISNAATHKLREQTSTAFLSNYRLKGNPEKIKKAIQTGLKPFAATQLSGLAEFYAAKDLLQVNEISAAVVLMSQAWKKTDFDKLPDDLKHAYTTLTKNIFSAIGGDDAYSEESLILRNAYKQAIFKYNEPENSL